MVCKNAAGYEKEGEKIENATHTRPNPHAQIKRSSIDFGEEQFTLTQALAVAECT